MLIDELRFMLDLNHRFEFRRFLLPLHRFFYYEEKKLLNDSTFIIYNFHNHYSINEWLSNFYNTYSTIISTFWIINDY